MKIVKPVYIPLDILLHALRSGRPKVISVSGVRTNVNDTAAALIESLIFERDEKEEKMRNIANVAGGVMPELCRIMALCFPDDFDDDSDDDHESEATVISALVVN